MRTPYRFDADMADHAIDWMRKQKAVNSDKPFFAYYTPGTAHAPPDWIEKFKGKFDHCWDRAPHHGDDAAAVAQDECRSTSTASS